MYTCISMTTTCLYCTTNILNYLKYHLKTIFGLLFRICCWPVLLIFLAIFFTCVNISYFNSRQLYLPLKTSQNLLNCYLITIKLPLKTIYTIFSFCIPSMVWNSAHLALSLGFIIYFLMLLIVLFVSTSSQ